MEKDDLCVNCATPLKRNFVKKEFGTMEEPIMMLELSCEGCDYTTSSGAVAMANIRIFRSHMHRLHLKIKYPI